jgi:hypothetical protein
LGALGAGACAGEGACVGDDLWSCVIMAGERPSAGGIGDWVWGKWAERWVGGEKGTKERTVISETSLFPSFHAIWSSKGLLFVDQPFQILLTANLSTCQIRLSSLFIENL